MERVDPAVEPALQLPYPLMRRPPHGAGRGDRRVATVRVARVDAGRPRPLQRPQPLDATAEVVRKLAFGPAHLSGAFRDGPALEQRGPDARSPHHGGAVARGRQRERADEQRGDEGAAHRSSHQTAKVLLTVSAARPGPLERRPELAQAGLRGDETFGRHVRR
jgi:hypothetical protein